MKTFQWFTERRRSRIKRLALTLVPLSAVPYGAHADAPGDRSGFSAGSGRPFAERSAWNTPIPADPVLDENSAAVVRHLSSEPPVANIHTWGVPVYFAESGTRRYPVRCTHTPGRCALERQPVPIPDGARPSAGSDAAMVVIDVTARRSYEFLGARDLGAAWEAHRGDVVDIDGEGRPGDAVGASVSRLAGVVRRHEIENGHIDHALVFSTDNACPPPFRYPAARSDGVSSRPDCIPEGGRIQLDPAVDVDAIPGITPGERAIARALQRYGAYAIDNGGATLALIFEDPAGGHDPYPAAGITEHRIDHIPWDRLRLLRSWKGD